MAFTVVLIGPDGANLGSLAVPEGTPIPEKGECYASALHTPVYEVTRRVWSHAGATVVVYLLLSLAYADTALIIT